MTAAVNDVYLEATDSAPTTEHLQELDATGARTAALVARIEHFTANASLAGTVQGSNDRGVWHDLSGGPHVSLSSCTVVGSGAAIAVAGWRWLRVEYVLTSSSGTVHVFLSAELHATLL